MSVWIYQSLRSNSYEKAELDQCKIASRCRVRAISNDATDGGLKKFQSRIKVLGVDRHELAVPCLNESRNAHNEVS